jgi:DNA-binding CsgD family transcriptional regulator
MLRAMRESAASVLALALFFFVFLAGEYCFDTVMGDLVGSDSVVLAQGLILGASAVGFLAYAPLERRLPLGRGVPLVVGALLLACCLVVLPYVADPNVVQLVGCVAFLVLGIAGGAAHRVASVSFARGDCLARLVAVSYAGGLLLQYLTNNLVVDMAVESAILAVFGVALMACLWRAMAVLPIAGGEARAVPALPEEVASNLRRELIGVTVAVVLMTCLFGTLDNIVTMANSRGDVQLASWPRLFLAGSALLAGWLFDLRGRRFMSLLMFCMAMLSTVAILVLEGGGSALACTLIFFLSSGFYAVYLTTAFIGLAPLTGRPALWAGMGRTLNNACALAIALPSLALVGSGDVTWVLIVDLVLFVGIALSLFASMSAAAARGAAEAQLALREQTSPVDLAVRLTRFQEDNRLTAREREVLEPVVATEEPLKQVALDLGISLRMVQRHLSSIYEKTGTQTRAGLSKRFWED